MNGGLTAARLCSSAHRRRHRKRLVAATLIIGFTGMVFLGAAAGARRSDSAFARMKIETRAAQLRVFGPSVDAATLRQLRAMPAVVAVGRARQLVATVDDRFQSFGAVADDEMGSKLERPRLLAGRRPRRDRVGEIAAPEMLATAMHIGVGDHLEVAGFSPAQVSALFDSGGQPPDPDGPVVRLRVVGITRAPSDLSIEGDAGGLMLATRAFFARYQNEIGSFAPVVLFVRLSDPRAAPRVVQFLRRHAGPESVASGEFQVQPSSEFEGGVQQSIDVLTTGMVVFASVFGLAGVAVTTIVLRRVADGFGADLAILDALGLPRRMRVGTVALSMAPVALAGGALALVGAFGLSWLMPFGTARRAEPHLGLDADPVVLVGGFALVVLVTLAVGVWAAHRVVVLAAEPPANRWRSSALLRWTVAAGMAPPATVGVAMSTEPGGRGRAVPTRTGVVAASLAVTGVVATLIVAVSLSALSDTPRAYGTNWDSEVVIGTHALNRAGGPCSGLVTEITEDPAVAGASEICTATGEVNGRGITIMGFSRLRGDVGPTVVEGRAPRSRHEAALGSDTLDEIGEDIGDDVRIASQAGSHRYRVVGRVVMPVLAGTSDDQAVAEGAILTGPAFAMVSTEDTSTPSVAITWRRGVDAQAAQNRLRNLPEGVRPIPVRRIPLEVERLEQVDALPRVLAALLAIVGCLGLAYTLVTAVRLRARDFATLKTLGFKRVQVVSTVAIQATLLAVVGVVVGVPLGIIVGRSVWERVVEGAGMQADTTMPVVALLAVAAATLVVANVVAAVPARRVARLHPAVVLKSE